MGITAEKLLEANKMLEGVDIGKGKKYILVNDRVKALRQICPGGSITTEILNHENGVVTMKATIMDDEGHVIATGMAQEKENAGFVNKTSYIENCETSAVGRALGFAGIGIDESMASADEVANAILQQNAKTSTITEKEQKVLKSMVEKKGYKVEEIFNKPLFELTGEEYTKAIQNLEKLEKKNG